MNQELKRVLNRIVIFSIAILIIHIITAKVLGFIYPEPKDRDDLDDVLFVASIHDYLQAGLLFLSAVLIAKKILILKYWKILLSVLAIVVLYYHLGYIYEMVDFYLIKGLSAPQEKEGLNLLMNLVSFEPTPPIYDPINHLVGWNLIFHGSNGSVSVLGIWNFLSYGSVSRAVAIGAVVYFYFRNKTQSTVDTE